MLPQATPKELLQEEESNLSKESLISQLAVLKAQLSLVENREEAARVRIMVLERQCQKKDEDLECLKDEMANMNPPKKRKEAPTESQILRHKLEALQGRLAEDLGEIESLKQKTQEQAELVELLQGDLYDKHYQAEDLCIKIRSLEVREKHVSIGRER